MSLSSLAHTESASARCTVCKAATVATAALPATGILRVVGALDVISSRSQLSHYLRAIRALKLHARSGCTAPIGALRGKIRDLQRASKSSWEFSSGRVQRDTRLGNRVNKRAMAVTYFNSPPLCSRPNYADGNGTY